MNDGNIRFREYKISVKRYLPFREAVIELEEKRYHANGATTWIDHKLTTIGLDGVEW